MNKEEYKARIVELEHIVRELTEKNQKLNSNLNERMPAKDRKEKKCRCKNPNRAPNSSSDHGNTHLCYNCNGWSRKV